MKNNKLIQEIKKELIRVEGLSKLDKSISIKFEHFSGSGKGFIEECRAEGLNARERGYFIDISL